MNSNLSTSFQRQSDSLRIEFLKKVIKQSYKDKQWDIFHKNRLEQIRLSSKLKDSSTLAKTLEYSGAYFRNLTKIDSAYFYFYKSYKIYDNLKDSLQTGKILVNLAILEKNTRDYKGSEQTSFKAIRYLTPSNSTRRVASMYNNLGVVYNEQGDVVNAIKYHEKALQHRKEMKNPLYLVHSLNNIGKLYKDNGQYTEAFQYFEKALTYKTVLESYPLVRATVLDNYTHTLFKSGKKEGIIESSLKILAIREKENDRDGIIISCVHLAEYFNALESIKKAITYAERAEKVSLDVQNFRDYLVSLELISSMYETPKAQEHFKKYVRVRDSLDKVALSYKNQFDRIRFETDEKNEIIKEQSIKLNKNKNIVFFILITLGLISLFIMILKMYKSKAQKELQKKLQLGFEKYLKEKYAFSNQNIEFWKIWVAEHGQELIAQKLFITVDAVKSRRRSLKNKIHEIEKIDGNFDRSKAIILFHKEREFYKNQTFKR